MDFSTGVTRLIHANFFFVDIVGLSDPYMSTKTQIKKIEVLNKAILESETFKSVPLDTILCLPTGDGMCLGFLQGPELPLRLAIELQFKLEDYNKSKIPSETVRVRIGLHSGNCFVVKDVKNNDNVWGPGTILARRVMDFGDDGHILLTPNLAEDLQEISDEYKKIITPVHDFTIKHGKTMLVYSAYGENFGNPKHPTKGDAQQSRYSEEAAKMEKNALYPSLDLEIELLDSEKMLVKHTRTYEIINKSDKPIEHVLHGIATDVEKYSISELNLQAYDKNNKKLKISSINVDNTHAKEFTTEFNDPIKNGERGKKYTLTYEVEEPERYFENAFLTDVEEFSIKFTYPIDVNFKPQIYFIDQETDRKIKSENQPTLEKKDKCIVKFGRRRNIKGETIRLEW